MRLLVLLLWVATLLTACTGGSVQKIGAATYAPLPSSEEVLVFTAENQIKQPFEVVGIISYDNPGKFQILSLGNAIEPLKIKARQVGGNAIVIDKSQPVKSGIISTGIEEWLKTCREHPVKREEKPFIAIFTDEFGPKFYFRLAYPGFFDYSWYYGEWPNSPWVDMSFERLPWFPPPLP